MLKKNLILLYIVTFVNISFAGNIKFTASTNKETVAVGERFTITFSANTNISNFNAPDLSNFRILSGPNQSTSMQWINGQFSTQISYSYVLLAIKEGEFTIKPATAIAEGNIIKSNELHITVVESSSASKSQNTGANTNQQASSGENIVKKGTPQLDDKLFIKAFLSKSTVYEGEQLIVSYKLYTRVNITSLNPEKMPELNGFWSQDIITPFDNIKTHRENINGIPYTVAVLKKTVLFPQRTGKLKIDPFIINCRVKIRTNTGPRSWFDTFFDTYTEKDITIASPSLKINVKPLPQQGKDISFNGAVGKFSISASVDKSKLKANEALNFTISIQGSGNLYLIDLPKIQFPPDFEVYDPKVSDNISARASGVSGKKTFEYLIIPRVEGNYQIPSVTFSYFDPELNKYKTLKTEPFDITVEKSQDNANNQLIFSGREKEELKYLGKDIHYIKTNNIKFKKKNNYFITSPLYFSLLSVPVLLFIIIILIRKKNIEERKNIVALRRKQAKKIAIKRLAKSKILIKNDSKEFFEEVYNAIMNYLSFKLNIDIANLNKETIVTKLKNAGIEENIIKKLQSIIENCEMAQYAPVSGFDKKNIYKESENIITTIEQNFKNNDA